MTDLNCGLLVAEGDQEGVTWRLQPLEDDMGTLDELRARIRKGPPKL